MSPGEGKPGRQDTRHKGSRLSRATSTLFTPGSGSRRLAATRPSLLTPATLMFIWPPRVVVAFSSASDLCSCCFTCYYFLFSIRFFVFFIVINSSHFFHSYYFFSSVASILVFFLCCFTCYFFSPIFVLSLYFAYISVFSS